MAALSRVGIRSKPPPGCGAPCSKPGSLQSAQLHVGKEDQLWVAAADTEQLRVAAADKKQLRLAAADTEQLRSQVRFIDRMGLGKRAAEADD